MQIKHLDGAVIDFPDEERETAELVEEAFQQAMIGLDRYCGVRPSVEIQFCCFRTWRDLFWRYESSQTRLKLILFLPLVYRQMLRHFDNANAWCSERSSVMLVGVKPIRMFAVRKALFTSWHDRNERQASSREGLSHEVRSLVIGAYLRKLGPPDWLSGGIGCMINECCDRSNDVPTDLPAILMRFTPLGSVPDNFPDDKDLSYLSQEEVDRYAAPATVGFWVTRFIELQRPGLIRSLFQRHCCGGQFDDEIATAFGLSLRSFRAQIVRLAAQHYREFPPTASDTVATAQVPLTFSPHPTAAASHEPDRAGNKNIFRCTTRSKIRAGSFLALFCAAAVAVGFMLWLKVGFPIVLFASPLVVLPILVGLFHLRDLLRLLSIVEVDDESISIVNWRGVRKKLLWREIGTVRMVQTETRLELRSRDRRTAIRLETEFTNFKQLQRIIHRRTRLD